MATVGGSQTIPDFAMPLSGEKVRKHAQFARRPVESVEPQSYFSYLTNVVSKIWGFCVSVVCRAVSIVVDFINWIIENRFGMAKLTGILVVPSQCFRTENYKDRVDGLCKAEAFQNCHNTRVTICDGGVSLEAVICYPENWDPDDKSRCILFHSPNAVFIEEYFDESGRLKYILPGALQKHEQCPVIIYDYRGTGLNKSEGVMGYLPTATCETILQDGSAVLRHALQEFAHVMVAGSSLGGGVATASLERVLGSDKIAADRVSLLSHDSFTTTPRVVMPGFPRFADSLGWMLGGYLNAEMPMAKLIGRGVRVVVMNDLYDPVIPEGARMSEWVDEFVATEDKDKSQVLSMKSSAGGHCSVARGMDDFLAGGGIGHHFYEVDDLS